MEEGRKLKGWLRLPHVCNGEMVKWSHAGFQTYTPLCVVDRGGKRLVHIDASTLPRLCICHCSICILYIGGEICVGEVVGGRN